MGGCVCEKKESPTVVCAVSVATLGLPLALEDPRGANGRILHFAMGWAEATQASERRGERRRAKEKEEEDKDERREESQHWQRRTLHHPRTRSHPTGQPTKERGKGKDMA